jgi:UDP-glucose 4-epimerase
MHIFVTGGAGFIGSHLVEHHLAKGDQVHAIDDLSTGLRSNVARFEANPDFRFTQADVLTWDGLDKAVGWADRVYHMAAVVGMFRVLEDPVRVLAINIAGTERVLRAAKSGGWHPDVVIASTSEVYGHGFNETFTEESPLLVGVDEAPRWNYAISKLANESFGLSYARDRAAIPVRVARLFNTIGPRQTGRYGMVVPRFISQALSGGPIRVFGDGGQTRSFCDVRDTVVALDLLAGSPQSVGKVANVGNNQEISIRDLADRIRRLADSNAAIETVPYEVAYGMPFEDIRRRATTFTRLRELTGFTPHWQLDDTLTDLITAHRRAQSQQAA